MNKFRCVVLDSKYNYCELVEIDLDEYFIEFPVPHSLVPEYYAKFDWSGVTPSIHREEFMEILGELEKRTAEGV